MLHTFHKVAEDYDLTTPSSEIDIESEEHVAQDSYTVLAALVVGASFRPDLQRQLDLSYRQALAQAVVVEGKRSMDLLQSVLIYLTWHHHYLRHEDQQIYQYLQLAVGMVTDLELQENTENLESARALVGCYYLSAGLSLTGFQKPTTLRCNNAVAKAAEYLASSADTDSDRCAPALVALFKVVEDMTESNAMTVSKADAIRTRLLEWKMRHLRDNISAPVLSSYYHVDLTTSERLLILDHDNRHEWSVCLIQAQHLLDHIMRQPLWYFRSMSIVEWMHLVSGTLSFARVSVTNDSRASVIAYLEQQMSIMQDLMHHQEESMRADELFGWYRRLLSGLRRWLLRQQKVTWVEGASGGWCPFATVKKMYSQIESNEEAQLGLPEPVLDTTNDAFWGHFMTDWPGLANGWMLPSITGSMHQR